VRIGWWDLFLIPPSVFLGFVIRKTLMGTGFSYHYYSNSYLYSGKEIDRMNGLNEYDFSARWMDNAVPGFTTPDPLAELHYSESPYSYCGANPVNRVDPTGLAYFAGDGGAIWREGDNNDTWTDPRTHQKYSNIGDYYTFRTSGGTQTDYKGKFDSFVDDPAPDSKNYSFFNYGSMNGAKDNTGIANNSTTGWKNDQNGESADHLKKLPAAVGTVTDMLNTAGSAIKMATPIAEKVLRRELTRPTTVFGAALAIGPAAYNILFNAGWGTTEDWINIGIGAGAIALEYSGGGEILDAVSVVYSVGTVVYDINNLNNEHK